jgi:hypothetical protein
MKRFFYLVVLMVLSSSAQAGNSVSFVVAGHRVTIEAPRDCNSPSCVSVSIPGIYQTHGGRDRYDDDDDASDAAVPVKPPAAQQQQVSSIIQPASKPATEPTAAPPPPAVVGPAATLRLTSQHLCHRKLRPPKRRSPKRSRWPCHFRRHRPPIR